MIRRSPCEYYTKYLILQSVKKTDAEIKQLLHDEQLDFISVTYMTKLRAQCRPPEPFFPFDKKHTRSRNFLISEGVEDLFENTKDVQLAKSILKAPRAKEFVEAMTLTAAPVQAIALALSRQRQAQYTNGAVRAYQRYFWNIELVDTTEMRALLAIRSDLAQGSTDTDVQGQAKAFRNAAYNDPRRVAAQIAHSPLGARIAQMRMGFMPSNDELSKAVELVRFTAIARALEASTFDGPNDSKRALDYAVVAEKMGTVLEQIVKPDEDLRHQLSTISMRTNAPNKAPSLKQLSGGNHTTEILPGAKNHDARKND